MATNHTAIHIENLTRDFRKEERKMRKVWFLITVLVVLVLATLTLAACGPGPKLTNTITYHHPFRAETTTNVHELPIDSRRSVNSLSVELNLEAGQVAFRLTSPDGRVEWEEAFTAPASYEHKFALGVTPGTWKLTIELKDATGLYDIELSGRP